MMKWHTIVAVTCVVAGACGNALATNSDNPTVPKKPVSQWTCQEFLDIQDDFKPQVMYWVEAINKKGKPREAVIDVGGTETVTPRVVEICKAKPDSKFWTSVQTTWQKIEKKM